MDIQALLSPHSQTALAFSGETAYLLEIGRPPQLLQAAGVSAWLAAHEETRQQSADNWAALEQSLTLYSRRREALDLALISLDNDLTLDLREESQHELDILLADSAIHGWLSNVFHLRPLSADADTANAQTLACSTQRVSAWLDTIIQRQDFIADSWAAWSAIPDDLFQAAGGRQAVLDWGFDNSLFVQTLSHLAERQADKAKFQALLSAQKLPGGRLIVETWLRPLSGLKQVAKRVKMEFESAVDKSPDKTKHKKRLGYDRKKSQQTVESQKANIIQQMRSSQWDKAELGVEGLLDYQQRFGGGQYAAKSLCDLATEAKALGRHDIQLKLTREAIEQNPEDGWAWSQYGDALLNSRHLDDAFSAFENAIGFGGFLYGKTGQAEVLKAQGHYSKALATYAEIILEYPYEPVPRNGRAEVLKMMGRYADALDAYETTLREHPQNVVAKAGRAEVLKAMGRYADALDAYETTMREHPENVVAKAGRADVLKAMGRYADALDAYATTMREHPEDVVAKAGRAEVLKAMGRYADALDAYETTMREHPQDEVTKNGRADVLKAMGRYADALDAYTMTMREHPQDVVAKNGRAEVLKAMGRYADALDVYETTMREHPENVVAKAGRAEVLKAMGRYADALDAYATTMREHPENVIAKAGRAEVLKAMGRYADALDAYATTMREHPENVVAKAGRAEVLKAMGRLDEAASAYALIRQQHPEDYVARNGYAAVLAMLGDYSQALALLPATKPEHLQDWIGWHIRGMILLRQGQWDQALPIFTQGAAESPAMSRDYFRVALAMANAMRQEWAQAEAQLSQVSAPELRRTGNVIWLQIHAARDNQAGVEQALAELSADNPPALVVELTDELRLRYSEKKPGRHDDQWLRERMVDCLALAA